MGLAQITIAAAQVDAQRLGYMAISLNAYDTTAEPSITAGSKVEVCGALYQAGADEAITGWAAIASSTDAYIKLVPAGAAVTAEFTDDVPTWDDAKQGWYDGLDRYVAKLYKDAGDLYTLKRLLTNVQQTPVDALVPKIVSDVNGVLLRCKVIEIGDWNMDSTISVIVTHGLTATTIRSVGAIIRNDSGIPYNLLSSGIAPTDGAGAYPSGTITPNGDTGFNLRRLTGVDSLFDNTSFDSTGYNRGWVIIWYEA